MRWILGIGAFVTLAACEPPIPDSAAGVTFEPRISDESTVATDLRPAGSVGSEALDVLSATAPQGTETVEASPSNPAPVPVDTSGISDENDFAAVDSRRSIEADAERRQQIAAQYQQVEAQDLPERDGSSAPNIVEYALASDNPVGNRVYRRLGINGANRAARNCRAYPSSDQAQIDFLSRGGPERDPRGLDLDGDGYACGWDPTPFQKLRG